MKTLEELKQEMDSAMAAYATADDAEDITWRAWDVANDVYNAGWAAWDAAARDATYAREAYIVARDAYNKRLKELADENT